MYRILHPRLFRSDLSQSTLYTQLYLVKNTALSIVVPVFNEERTLAELMHRVIRSCGDFAQLIFVDDGSTDRSLAILNKIARPQDLVLSKSNGGKGSAVRAGFAHATGQYVIVQDADLEYSPEEIPHLLQHAQQANHPVVFGSRRLKKQRQYAHVTAFLGGSMLTWLCNLLYRTHLTDQPTCYKLIRRDILQRLHLRADDFRFDPEVTALLALRKISIVEFPISYTPRSYAEGKKPSWKDWCYWVGTLLALRFSAKAR